MPFKFNPLTGQLDLVSSLGGFVKGPATATDNAIARYDGTTGKLIADSKTVVQDSGAIEAQAFITRRSIVDLIVVPSGESWIAPELELEVTGSIELEADGELIII